MLRSTALTALSLVLAACSSSPLPVTDEMAPTTPPVDTGWQPLDQAHAHNDYEHDRPLFDALEHGFMSAEADVYVSPIARAGLGDDLYVAHDPQDIDPSRTLASLYLDPLYALYQEQGVIQPNQQQPFQLLIDFKTEAESTWAALEAELEPYADMLSRYENGLVTPGAVTVVISGNRPIDTLAAAGRRLAFIDGRLADLDDAPPVELFPLISDNWTNHFRWTGDGAMPAEESQQLDGIMQQAHSLGYRIRFWATPDSPGEARTAVWTRLADAGVHHLNTDDLAGLEAFLRSRQHPQHASAP